jgi:hypothetical protein
MIAKADTNSLIRRRNTHDIDDAAGYERACERHAEVSEKIADPAERIHRRLFLLSLRPIAPDQRAEFERLVEEALKTPPSANDARFRTAIALYRQDRHAEAMAMLDVVFATGGWQHRAKAWALRAMGHWKLGHHEEARLWLARTAWWIDLTNRAGEGPQLLGTPSPLPYVWLTTHVFHREAKDVIERGEVKESSQAAFTKSVNPLDSLERASPPRRIDW